MRKVERKDNLNVDSSINRRLVEAANLSEQELFEKYNSSISGMTEEYREESRENFGENKIQTKKRKSIFERIASAFGDPFTLILISLSIISLFTGVIFAEEGDKNPITSIIIIIMVLMSGGLRLIQETKSGQVSEKLLEMIETTCTIRKDNGQVSEIPIDEIVVGDIVLLSAGDMIPADLRILESKDLFVSQSALTGESMTVEKFKDNTVESNAPLDLTNLAFMGTNIISGTAVAIVVATGMDTIFGSIANSLNTEKENTSFETGINSVSMILIRFMLIMVPIVFVITGFTKGHWFDSLIFAISIAVGLTPEMLPMIITSCLSVGSMEMAKKKVIIKNLNSIQSLGAMNVLCTDKTGTLTEDKIVLQYHLDINGEDNTRVLRYGFLNSYYQTGLKNLMDKAIINKTMELQNIDPNLEHAITKYEKIDEIPFDFNRRRMSVVVRGKSDQIVIITKGAVEEVISICKDVEINEEVFDLDEELFQKVNQQVKDLNSQGMRVIAVARKKFTENITEFEVKDESDMTLIGFLAFLDPPKQSSAKAIEALMDHGVEVKVLTGDNKEVTENVCKSLNIKSDKIFTGEDIEGLSGKELEEVVRKNNIFAKLSPANKVKIVEILKKNDNIVGFMGDGINDAASLEAADVGISVSNAVDIAKESADVILLEKDLLVLEDGVIQGRKIYANMLKYIKITASSNFGNVFSILFAAIFLPFLPIHPMHLLMLNMIYDISCISFPWDNVDESFIKEPRRWEAETIPGFMMKFGPISSIFDIVTYLALYFIICPMLTNGVLFHNLTDPAMQDLYIAAFHTGWFIESMLSQTLVIHMLRTSKVPFKESWPSKELLTLNLLGIFFVLLIPDTSIGRIFEFEPLPLLYFGILIIIILLYLVLISYVKRSYLKTHDEIL